jgi:two-component system phosphate regulon response regulator PhoB
MSCANQVACRGGELAFRLRAVPSILVIEDEADLQQVLEYNLELAGHTVRCAGRGSDGLRMAREQPPDLVLLDLMLPDLSGTQVCRTLKADPRTMHIPVIMVSARSEEVDRIVGFELGADDYVVKPFSIRELLLRIQAVLRRSEGRAEPASRDLVICGPLRVDRAAHRAWVEEREVKLTALEFKLLIELYENRNRVLTRAQLLDAVWNIAAEITTRTVDTHVKRLREKLGAAGALITTVRGVGYRFTETEAPGEARVS